MRTRYDEAGFGLDFVAWEEEEQDGGARVRAVVVIEAELVVMVEVESAVVVVVDRVQVAAR